MNWTDCRYCDGGTMRPTGVTRQAPYDPTVIEQAYTCDNCDNHNDVYLWVESGKARPYDGPSIYGDYKPTPDPSPHAAGMVDGRNPQSSHEQSACGTWLIVGMIMSLFVLAAVAGLSVGW